MELKRKNIHGCLACFWLTAPGSGQVPQSLEGQVPQGESQGEVEAQSGRDETTRGSEGTEGEEDGDEATFKA